MSYLEKWACLYEDTEFTPSEQAEIGRFKMQMTKLAALDDAEGLVELFRNEFKDMGDEAFDQVDRYFEYLSLYDETPHEKVGRFPAIESVLGTLAVGMAATPLIEKAIGFFTRKSAHKGALKKIMQQHPELRRDPYTPQYFQALVDFAPDLAKNALVAGNVMKEMHRMGPSALNANMIRDLVGTQKDIPRFGTGIQDMAEPTMSLAKQMREHKSLVSGEDKSKYGKRGFFSSRAR